jgi:hypothetical protein
MVGLRDQGDGNCAVGRCNKLELLKRCYSVGNHREGVHEGAKLGQVS